MYVYVPWRSEEVIVYLGSAVTGNSELPYWFWELNSGPLQVLLMTEPSVNFLMMNS